jgi:diguanylate cyclase (GGDEF)-like protein/PAS domain S-box-containing protein
VTAFQLLQRILLPPEVGHDELRNWRERILSSILLVVVVLGSLAAVPSVLFAASEGLWAIAWIDAIALVWVLIIWRKQTLSYRFRAWNLLTLIYLLGIFFLFTVGPASEIYLMAFPVMAALLLGLRPALLALAINAASLLGIGYLANADLQVPGFETQPLLKWVVITINFMFINSVITISCAVLLSRLENSLERQRAITRSLQEGQAHLNMANEELRLTGTALNRLNDIVLITEARQLDGSGPRIVFVNEAVQQLAGYSREEVLGKTPRLFQGEGTDRNELDRIRTALGNGQAVRAEVQNYTKNHTPYWLDLNIVPVTDEPGRLTHFVSVGRDITERKKAEEDIHRLAYFDALTGLPNRRMLQDRLAHVLSTARRTPLTGALLYLDLDRFKKINDARGHAAGDELLVKVAVRLSALMREEDTVARLGGDEFVILTTHLTEENDAGARAAMAIASKVREALEQPFTIDGQPYSASGSIGVTLLCGEGQTVDDLLREADTAMYRAKAAGRNRIAFFEAAMQTEVEEHLALENDLAQAILLNQLALHLQCQVNPAGQPIGGELLLRWTHPVRGRVPPALFIPVAEETTLILRLGDWVMEQAFRTQVRLQTAGRTLPLSINVSPRQFHQPDFVERVTALLARTGANPAYLVLEVTEGLLIDNLENTISRMNEIAALGIRFSIDDFGTGYSSLSYLKRLPLYELKIDKSFIQDTPGDPSDTAIVQLILSMARHLGLRVVAEGVETREQADFLTAHGCDAMQGYLFAHPESVDDWLAQVQP